MDRKRINKIVIFFLISLMIIIISPGCKKKIPSTPDVLIPESTYTKAKTILQVSATDPNKDHIYYIVDWGDGIIDTFPSFDTIPLFNSGDTVPVYHIYEKWSPPRIPAYKNFEIIATAKDEKGNIQNIWSQPETIKVIYNEEPNRPIFTQKHEMGGRNTLQGFGATAIDPEGDSIAFHYGFFESDQWTKFVASGETVYANKGWTQIGVKQNWVIAKDIKGSISIPSETLEFYVLDEGYIKGVFQALTRQDDGEVDTVEMQSSPALVSTGGIDKIFIGSEGYYAYIINANDMRDEFKIDPFPIEWLPTLWGNSPAVDITNGRWFIATDVGEFFSLSLSCLKLWRYPNMPIWNFTEWSFTDAAFNGNYVYVATKDTLYCLNGNNGSKIWGYSIPGIDIKTAPIIDVQGDIYIGDVSGYVRKINCITGELKWKKDIGSNVPTSGAIDNISGIIYFGVNDGSSNNLCALEPDSGTLLWSCQINEKIINSPVIGTDGYIYIGDEQGRIYAVKDGIIKSGFPISIIVGGVNAKLSTPAFAADGYFYVMTEEQFVFCIGVDGNIRWETPLPTAGLVKSRKFKREEHVPSPVIGSDGDIYVASGVDIGLYRIQGRSSGFPANTPWPMFRHDRNHSGKAGFIPSRSP